MTFSNLAPYALAAQRGLALERDDPLRYFRYQCDGQRDFARFIFAGLDTHGHTGNEGGKTTTALAAFVAMGSGIEALDGLAVPRLQLPATFWLIVKSRRGAVDSSQAKLFELIGNRPHHVGWAAKGLDYAEVVRFKPYGWRSDDPQTWSKFVIHSEEGDASLPGGRIDGAIGDEPPNEKNWDEVRSRAKSNCPLYLAIAETPVKKSEWWWLFHEQSGYLNCLGKPRDGRVSVNWSVRDLRCHSAQHIRELEDRHIGSSLQKYEDGKLIADPRMDGWPVDDENASPFDAHALNEMRLQCCPPLEVWEVALQDETDDEHDRETLARSAKVQVWVCPETWHRGRIVVDPSAGINDGRHDPNGFLVLDEVDPTILARYNGYLDPYSLGYLAGTVGKRWAKVCGNHPQIDVEMQNGWGGEAIKALRRMRYPNIGHRMVVENPLSGKRRPHYGFPNTDSERSRWIAAIQAGLIRKSFKCWSREVVDCLTDVVLDERERAVKAPGGHIEDMIELGYGLHKILDPVHPTQRQKDGPDPLRAALRSDFGREIDLPDLPRDTGTDAIPEGFGLVR